MGGMRRSIASQGTRASEAAAEAAEASGVEVQVADAFGSRCGAVARDAVAFADATGSHAVYPLGRHMCFRHTESGESAFLSESPQVLEVVACTLSLARTVLAVCERCASLPVQVTMYSLRTSGGQPVCDPVRTLQDLGRMGQLACMALSPDLEASYLAVASCAPDLVLAVLDWRENVVLGRCSLAAPVSRLALSPLDDDVVSASGESFLKLWRLPAKKHDESGTAAPGEGAGGGQEEELRVLPDPAGLRDIPSTFTDHAWSLDPADGTLVTITEEGDIVIILAQASAPLRVLRRIDGGVPRCVRCFAGGFAIGGDSAALSVWTRRVTIDLDDPLPEAAAEGFRLVAALCVLPPPNVAAAILSLDVSGASQDGQARLLIGFSDSNVGLLNMPSADSAGGAGQGSVAAPAEVEMDGAGAAPSVASAAAAEGQGALCEFLSGGAHRGPVTSLDIAVQRPIIVTASRQECSVRVWNYASKECELSWRFPGEEPLAVAMHPLGFLAAVAFFDKIRVVQVLADELKPHRLISAKGVRLLKFSNGGHLLAAAKGRDVLVLSSRTLAKVAQFKVQSQQVASLCFHPDDRSLVVCGDDGALAEWSTSPWKKVNEHAVDRALGAEARSVAAGCDGRVCVAVEEGGRHILRYFRQCAPVPNPDTEFPTELLALSYHDGSSGAAVFATSLEGSLWWAAGPGMVVVQSLGLHIGPCHCVRMSVDGRTVVTCGEDGLVFVLRVTGLEADTGGKGRPSCDVVMVNRSDMQAREEEIQELFAEAAALKVHLVEESTKMQTECVRRVHEARQQDRAEVEALRSQCEALQQQSMAQEKEALRQMRSLEAKHVQVATDLEATYDKKLVLQEDHHRDLEQELRSLAESLVGVREDAIRDLSASRARHEAERHQRVGEKDAEVQKLKDLITFSKLRFDTVLDQEIMEHDLESSQLWSKAKTSLDEQQAVEYRLKKEQDTILRGLDMMERDKERAAHEQYETSLVLKSLTEEVDKLQQAVDALKSDRRDRETTLRDKELEIGAYKVKVNTLKKFKHVLDFRLHEVTLSLQPKDETIAQLSGQLRDMEQEFEANLDQQKQSEARSKDFDCQIKDKASECTRLRQAVQSREKMIREFTEDLRNLATKEQDIRKWPDAIRGIYKKHARLERMEKDIEMAPATQELGRQIKSTEKKAATMSSIGRSAEEESQAEIRKQVDHNFELIRELDHLRKERKELHARLKQLELRVQQAEKAQVLASSPPGSRGASRGESRGASRGEARGASRGEPRGEPRGDSRGNDGSRSGRGAEYVATVAVRPALPAKDVAPRLPARAAPSPQSPGRLRKVGSHHRLPEERRQMERLLTAAEMRTQHAQMQRLEHKLLSDRLDSLQAAQAVMGLGGAGNTA